MNLHLVFFLGYVHQNTLISLLNSRQEIRNWYLFGNLLALVSTASTTDVQNILLTSFYNQSFIVTPISRSVHWRQHAKAILGLYKHTYRFRLLACDSPAAATTAIDL